MSRQIQGQQQNVTINLAPKPKRKKRKKKKSKAIHSVGDFRTALARSAYIQRGVGGLGFYQAPPFLKDIDANAVRLNARSQFEGTRRQRPTLKHTAIQTDNNFPLPTATGSTRGQQFTPRLLSTDYHPLQTEEGEEEEEEGEDFFSPIAARLRRRRKRSPYF